MIPHWAASGSTDAPLLVLGGSLGTTGAMWRPQLATLAARFRVVRYDHRGHGRSAVPPGPYRIDDLGGDLLELLDLVAGPDRPVHLAGLSLGGMVALWVAANAPDRVDRLALLCTAARLEPAEMWTGRAEAVRAGGTAAIVDAVSARWFTPAFAADNPAVVATYRTALADTPTEGYAGCCEAIAAMDLTGCLPSVRAETLVIAGADDPATPPAYARAIAAGIPSARVAVLSDAAHLANVEQPVLVGSLLVDFFSGSTDDPHRERG